MFVPSFWPNLRVDFSENWHDYVLTQLKSWPKIRKVVTMVMGEKKAKNGTLTRETLGATDLKLGMHMQLNSGSNMGWVPPGHISFSHCVRLKIPIVVLWK